MVETQFYVKKAIDDVSMFHLKIRDAQEDIEETLESLQAELQKLQKLGRDENHHSRQRRDELYNSVLRLATDCMSMENYLQEVETNSSDTKMAFLEEDAFNISSVIQVINIQDTSLQAIYMTVDELRRYMDEIQIELRSK